MERDTLCGMEVMLLGVAVALVLCSCQQFTAAPYPTVTPQVSPTPTIDCWAIMDLRVAGGNLPGQFANYTVRWNRWMERVDEGSVSPEAIEGRLSEFLMELQDFRKRASQIAPLADAPGAHELFLEAIDETERGTDLLLAYYRTGNEGYRTDGNTALRRADALRRKYENQYADLYERCFGTPVPEGKQP